MASTSEDRRQVRLEVSIGSIVLVLVAIAAAFLAAGILVEARRIISWVVACAVVAALIELVVNWLDRWMRRPIAIVLTLLALAGIAGTLVFGVFSDLDNEIRRLKTEAPIAAQRIENSQRIGDLAGEIDLDRRVTEAVSDLSSPATGLAGEAVSSVGTYVVCAVLTVLFLSWGPRLARSALDNLDRDRSARVEAIAQKAFASARRYVSLALLQSLAVGLIGWGVCLYLDLPAPAPLALTVAAFALIPSFGVVLGAMPMLLLTAGTQSVGTAAWVLGGAVVTQLVSALVTQPRIVRRSGLYVGPAVIVVAALVGFELYGLGGAMYGMALSVLLVAISDATADVPRADGSPAVDEQITEDEIADGEECRTD